jgi:DNA-binding transcriptional LysR family regulator
MRVRDDLSDLAAFAVVAEERSFTRAAARLGVSQSALSHTMCTLEKRLGVQLLARTTRHVSPTPAGNSLLNDLSPALERIRTSLAEVRKLSHTPAGRLRLVLPRAAVRMVLLPKLRQFTNAFPHVVLDVTASNEPVDLVASDFDAGIHIGELIQRDMIAVRVSADLRLAVVGSPDYFQRRPIPQTPEDLKVHSCIGFRFGGKVYRWEFEKGRKMLTVYPQGPITFDDPDLVIRAALKGIGVGTALEQQVERLIAQRRLTQVLQDWCPTFPGFFLYYPSRRNRPAALDALIDSLRL